MKINGIKTNIFKDIIIPATKRMFNFKKVDLVRQPAADTVEVSLLKENFQGISSKTFKKLLSPEFTPKTNLDESGLRITTLIDKKTNKPVNAYIARVDEDIPNMEKYYLMVPDANGEINIKNKNYRVVGDTYFYIDKEQEMISPKFEGAFINGELCEKVLSYMDAKGNKEYGGIGTRMHQLRVERMLQNGLGNVCIVAEGNSFPFHYSMGYRLATAKRPIEDSTKILQEFSSLNQKSPRENSKYIFLERDNDKKVVINWSATLEHFLNDYYKNDGTPLVDFSTNKY
ncbi:MAG: hypothetical protein K8V75_03470 [Methanobrevibacter woesei]|nr:hypothetical protein [Methanobrevibacter woesei]